MICLATIGVFGNNGFVCGANEMSFFGLSRAKEVFDWIRVSKIVNGLTIGLRICVFLSQKYINFTFFTIECYKRALSFIRGLADKFRIQLLDPYKCLKHSMPFLIFQELDSQ